MKRKLLLTAAAALSVALMGAAVACGNPVHSSDENSSGNPPASSAEALTLEEFKIPESAFVELGETYTCSPVSAKDSAGNWYVAVVKVTNAAGEEMSLTQNVFTPEALGDYTVTYTVTFGNNQTESKSYTLEVGDMTEPEIESEELLGYNMTVPGTKVDLTSITVSDNSGEEIAPIVKVYFGDDEVTVGTDKTFTASEQGTYTISVTASDSSENTARKNFYVQTVATMEDDIYYLNEWYASQISNKFARFGEKSYEIGLFDEHTNWFEDFSMLGQVGIVGDCRKVSFWMYYDFEGAGYNGTSSVNGQYYDMKVYDIYGDEVSTNWQNKYEFTSATWYRVVVDLNAPLVEGYAAADSLYGFKIFFGLWNLDTGNNVIAKGVKVYLDQIRLLPEGDEVDEYDEKPAPPVVEKIPGEVTTLGYTAMFNAVRAADGAMITENALADYGFRHGKVTGTIADFKAGTRETADGTANVLGDLEKGAYMESWRMYTGFNDAVIYEVRAKQEMFVDFCLDAAADGALGGWVDTKDSTVTIYKKAADGTITALYTSSNEKAADFYPDQKFYLQEGETLYYEYLFPWEDYRNVSFPVAMQLYTAIDKPAENQA